MTKKKYIVLVGVGIGGAEKRFIDIFSGLKKKDPNIFLVVSAKVCKVITAEMPDIVERIIVIGRETDSLLQFVFKYILWVCQKRGEVATFHYPINCLFFAHLFMTHKVTASLTDAKNVPELFSKNRSLFKQYLILRFAEKIDVLNPSIYKGIQEKYPREKAKVSLTPNGTYVNPQHYVVIKKRAEVVLMSRLISREKGHDKGIEDFLCIVGDVAKRARVAGHSAVNFSIVGTGPLSAEVELEVNMLSQAGVPIKYCGYQPAKEVFSDAAIVLSLQKVNNYPSRVVAEALMSGSSAIIRDVGESRLFGDPQTGIYYVDKRLFPTEVADVIIRILDLLDADPNYPRQVRAAAIKRFSDPAVLNYFQKLMD